MPDSTSCTLEEEADGSEEEVNDSGLRRDSLLSSRTDLCKIGNGGVPSETIAVVIIGDRILFRDCLAKCLTARNCLAATFSSVTEWHKAAAHHAPPSVVLLCSRANAAKEIQEELSLLARPKVEAPVVFLSEAEDTDYVIVALDSGARGYIQTSVTLDVAVEAIRLVGVGGAFVAAPCVRSARPPVSKPAMAASVFTERELSVLGALQQGKANKRVAYDLKMSESTVKVHVRNIMKKLKARNRTEVAFLTRNMFPFARKS